jgi:hypothetical protein
MIDDLILRGIVFSWLTLKLCSINLYSLIYSVVAVD